MGRFLSPPVTVRRCRFFTLIVGAPPVDAATPSSPVSTSAALSVSVVLLPRMIVVLALLALLVLLLKRWPHTLAATWSVPAGRSTGRRKAARARAGDALQRPINVATSMVAAAAAARNPRLDGELPLLLMFNHAAG